MYAKHQSTTGRWKTGKPSATGVQWQVAATHRRYCYGRYRYQFIATLAAKNTMPSKRNLSSRIATCAAVSFQVVSGFQLVQHVPSNSPTHVPTWKANSRPSSTTRLHISSPLSAPGIPAIDVSENSPRDVPYMLEWAEACGVQKAEGFELTSDDGGYDVYARTVVDMPAGSPVVVVPEQMILSSNKAAAELRSDDMEQAEKLLASLNAEDEIRQFYLMIKVLLELEKGQDSPWFPWFNSLPRYYTNAASMTPVSVDSDVGLFCFYNISIPSLLLNQWIPSYRNRTRMLFSFATIVCNRSCGSWPWRSGR